MQHRVLPATVAVTRGVCHWLRTVERTAERHWALSAYGVLTVSVGAYIVHQLLQLN